MRARLAATATGLALAASLLPSAPAAQGLDEVRIRITPVAGTVLMLEGRGGNIAASIGDDGILVIDDQFAPLAEKIRAALRERSPSPITFLLNTHWHGDHTGGNAEFGKEATIIAHENVRRRLATVQDIRGRKSGPQPDEALPVITFPDSLTIHFNGEAIQARHFPRAHTDGDIVITFPKSNVVHLGDLFFAGAFPYVDLDHGGDVAGLIAAVTELVETLPENARLIPGHGPLSSREDLAVYLGMLRETRGLVEAWKAEGLGVEQMQERGLPDKWESWGQGFIDEARWIATLAR